MLRKPFIALSLILFGLFLMLLLTSSGLAAPAAQEKNPGERLRPDQSSYRGVEDMPFVSSPRLPEVEDVPINSPVDSWSKMTFESYVDGAGWEIYFASGSFTNLVRLTNNNSSDIHPRLNRGCTRIAFASFRDGVDFEIYTMNTDGSNLVRLTNNGVDDVKPVWSPDGTKIAFQSYRDGHAEVYVMNADGSGQTRLTYLGQDGYNGEPTWSPDGNHIAFTSYRNNLWRIWLMDVNGANQYQLSQQAYSELPVWSPDGSQIGYDADSDDDGWQELWSMNSDGSFQTMRADPGYNQTLWANGWSPDGKWLLYTDVQMSYYEPYWYWEYAWLYKIDQYGISNYVNPGRYLDWNVDWTTSDKQPPSSSVSALPSTVPYRFTVTWSGQDTESGWLNNDVQVRDGSSGAWTNWQMATTALSADFTGIGGHDYYFRTRARDNAFNVQDWTANYQARTRVESAPPITLLNPLEAFTRGTEVTLSWEGDDPGGSGISAYDVQVMDDAVGVWQDWLTNTMETSSLFSGEIGHTYHFRLRATDNALNVEAWTSGNGDATTIMFSWLAAGMAHDNTGVPVAGMDVSIDPEAFLTYPSDLGGHYSAYLASDPPVKTITWSKGQYGALPSTNFGLPDANVDVYLPPFDNVVQDFGFESGSLPGAWLAGGEFTPALTTTLYHSGDYAGLLGVGPTLSSREMLDSVSWSQYEPVADKLGGVHLAWISTQGVIYAHRLPDGTWLPNEVVYDQSNIGNVSMAVDGHQNVYMFITPYPDIIYLERDPIGGWSSPQVIYSGFTLIGMKVDASSNIHAILTDNFNLFYSHHEEGGGWEIETIPNVANNFKNTFTIGGSGQIHLAWTSWSTAKVYYMIRQPDGSWSYPVFISAPGTTNDISMVSDSNGEPHIIWTVNYPTYEVFYSTIKQDGSFDTPYHLSADGWFPRLLIDQQDTLYLLWEGTYTEEVYFAQKQINGDWTTPQNISNSDSPSGYVEGAIVGAGDVYAIWQEWSNYIYGVYYSRLHAGVWSAPIRLSADPSDAYFATVAADSMGGVSIVWVENMQNSVLYYVGSEALTQSGDSRVSQSLTVPASMANPTLSFLASVSGVSSVSGNEFLVQVSNNLSTTTILSNTSTTTWEHYWFDMTPWSGQEITLTFQLTENAGFPPASTLLDEVTLGTAHTDAWVELSQGALYSHPGGQFTFRLDYGNQSAILASGSSITLTLPTGLNFINATVEPGVIGSQLVWNLEDLPPDSTFVPIFITVEVNQSATLLQAVVTSVEITTTAPELELLNNKSEFETFLAYRGFLPIEQR